MKVGKQSSRQQGNQELKLIASLVSEQSTTLDEGIDGCAPFRGRMPQPWKVSCIESTHGPLL